MHCEPDKDIEKKNCNKVFENDNFLFYWSILSYIT